MTGSSPELQQPSASTDLDQLLLRAERLLEHSIAGLHEQESRRRRDRDQVGFALEQLLQPLEQLSGGLSRMIEEMAQHRQDNRLQRWQGQLQQLLTPLDASQQELRELVVLLDQPLEQPLERLQAQSEQSPTDLRSRAGEQQKRLQLVQLLALRQKQMGQLQSEVVALQRQLFESQQQLSQLQASAVPLGSSLDESSGEDQARVPSIFN
jgi:chromosome segregation ATPase